VSAPRLEIQLGQLRENTAELVGSLGPLGIEVCAVTKAMLGSPELARELLAGGARSLGESRIENIEHLRRAGITAPIALIRSPMMSQVDRIVASADLSLNSEVDVVERLAAAASKRGLRHGVLLMVELGDLREGIMPGELHEAVRRVLTFPGVLLRGIGTNLACQSGVVPDDANMAELSKLATSIEAAFGVHLEIISGGNSANLDWALRPGADVGRINQLRLGESILLGREPLRRTALPGLHQDAISLVAEVIESKSKPAEPWGELGETAFGAAAAGSAARSGRHRVIVALGRQDVDVEAITAPEGYVVLGASSDHLILEGPAEPPRVGAELRFDLGYSALLRAATSPFVDRHFVRTAIPSATPAGIARA
jgi:predicted amino acid racemase